MSQAREIDIFTRRLRTLARLIDIAAIQWRERDRDTAALVGARLVDDMFPLGHQVCLACQHAKSFAVYVLDGPLVRASPPPEPNTLAFADLIPLIDATVAHLDIARSVGSVDLSVEKRVDLPNGMYLQMPGGAYFDEWLLPNFYFHLVTAYDILRHVGVKIGKADYLAHLGPYLRGMAPLRD